MNLLFAIVFTVSTFLLLCTSPEQFLSALLDGAGKSASLCVSLVATYAVWMGLIQVWQDRGITKAVSKLVKPIAKKLFKTTDDEALEAISMNLSVNLLGISGAATPYGIKAAQRLDKTENAEYASAMLFVLNATSLQLLPTSIVAVRVALKSGSPTDIILPTIFATLLSTVLGVLLTKLFIKPAVTQKKTIKSGRDFILKNVKIEGVGTR